jgi:hypothetical protein
VITASFLGAIARVHVEGPNGVRIIAQIPSEEATQMGAGRSVKITLKNQPVFAKAV